MEGPTASKEIRPANVYDLAATAAVFYSAEQALLPFGLRLQFWAFFPILLLGIQREQGGAEMKRKLVRSRSYIDLQQAGLSDAPIALQFALRSIPNRPNNR